MMRQRVAITCAAYLLAGLAMAQNANHWESLFTASDPLDGTETLILQLTTGTCLSGPTPVPSTCQRFVSPQDIADFVGAGSDTFLAIEVDGTPESTAAPTINFQGVDFVLVESPADTFALTINSGIARDTELHVAVVLAGTPNYIVASGTDNQTLTLGLIDLATDVTGLLPNANLADMATDTIKMRNAAGPGPPEDLKIGALLDNASPGATDSLLAETAAGDLVRIEVGNLPGGGVGPSTLACIVDAASGTEICWTVNMTVNKAAGDAYARVTDITDTASPGLLIFDEGRIGGTAQYRFDEEGQLTLDMDGTFGNTTGVCFGDCNTVIYESEDNTLRIDTNGTNRFFFSSFFGGNTAGSAAVLNELSTTTNPSLISHRGDTTSGVCGAQSAPAFCVSSVSRITANTTGAAIGAGDGAAGNLGASSNLSYAVATVNSSASPTLTASNLIPAGAFLMGLTARITTSFGTTTGLTDFDVGDGSDVDRWANSLAITSGTTMDLTDATANASGDFPSAQDVVLTAVGGNFDATGTIELLAHFISLTAPTG